MPHALSSRLLLALGSATIAILSSACRWDTTRDNAVSAKCAEESIRPPIVDPMTTVKRCDDCCRRHDLSSVDQGSCSCGSLGLDKLFR